MQVAAGKHDIQRIEGASAKHGHQGHHTHRARDYDHFPAREALTEDPAGAAACLFIVLKGMWMQRCFWCAQESQAERGDQVGDSVEENGYHRSYGEVERRGQGWTKNDREGEGRLFDRGSSHLLLF